MKRRIHHHVQTLTELARKIKRRIAHLSARRRNRAIFGFILLNCILIFLIYTNLVCYPNTYIGKQHVSGKTEGQIRKLLEKQESITPKIQIKNRTYTYTYEQMGVVVDTQKAIADVFAPNKNIFPVSMLHFFQSLTTKRTLTPPLVFTQKFDQFVEDTVFDFSDIPDNVSIDTETKWVLVEENQEAYRMAKDSLTALLVSRFGQYDRPIYPQLSKITNVTVDQVIDINEKLANVFGAPIIVYLDLGGTSQAFEMKEEDIREVANIYLDSDRIHVTIDINPDALERVITKRVHDSGFPIRNNVVTQRVREDFAKAINLRFGGASIGAIATKLDDGPNTNGSAAAKYIEVDISQQKMYLFQNGKLLKAYTVSTGLDYPTPTGRFTIINKVGLGFSNIYNVWLPWWMGFKYSEELGAYFGIHEQPYILTEDGRPIIQGPKIGTPSTGGCVALAPGAAREVYRFGDIGTVVQIYQ